MVNISKEEIEMLAEALAPRLVDNVRKGHHDFWIDPEKHYNDHQLLKEFDSGELYELKNLVGMVRTTKSLWFKAFLGFAIIGTIIMSAVGVGAHKWFN